MSREYKILVMGSGGVGKSALTVQFVQDYFPDVYDPTIEDAYIKQGVEVDDHIYTLEILDTAGSDQFKSMRDVYISSGQGFILVYSVTDRNSYNDLNELLDKIIKVKDAIENPENVPVLLVGNKCDLEDERIITKEEGEELAVKFCNAAFMETSAKARIGVTESFHQIVREITKRMPRDEEGGKRRRKRDKFCLVN